MCFQLSRFLSRSQVQDIKNFSFTVAEEGGSQYIKRVPGSLTTMECNIDGIITAFERDISRPLFAWYSSHVPNRNFIAYANIFHLCRKF